VVVVLSLLAVGCGRFGFPNADGGSASDGPIDGGDGGGGGGDGGADAAIDVMVVGPGTTTFGETPAADVTNVTADTSLSTEAGSTMTNRGASTTLECETSQKRTLVRFDLTALAPGTPVTGVQLHLQFGGSGGSTATLRPLLESWTEGTQSGTTGVANSVQRTSTANWTTAGADAPGSAGASIASFAASTGANTVALPVATVQGWINNPASNFGIMIACTGDSSIVSRENATATSRPQLDVTHQ